MTGNIICDSFIAEEDSVVKLSGNSRQIVSAKTADLQQLNYVIQAEEYILRKI